MIIVTQIMQQLKLESSQLQRLKRFCPLKKSLQFITNTASFNDVSYQHSHGATPKRANWNKVILLFCSLLLSLFVCSSVNIAHFNAYLMSHNSIAVCSEVWENLSQFGKTMQDSRNNVLVECIFACSLAKKNYL